MFLCTVVIIGFAQCQYSFEEGADSFITIEILEGRLSTGVLVSVASSDQSAQGILNLFDSADY